MEHVGFQTILVLLAVSVVVVGLFRYLHLPQVLAYLFVGLLVGPSILGWVKNTTTTHHLAEFGLVFLMFSIGLEFSLPRLRAMKSIVFGLGGAQVFITFVVITVAAWLFGVSLEGAIVMGGILSLSSTAIVMKLLIEQLEQSSRHGRYAMGVLLFQDIIVVPFLILIPALAGGTETSFFHTFGWVLVKSALVLVGILLFGRYLLRPLFHEVALAHSREFFMLTVLLITLSAAWITEFAGLSLALGAFLAGMMIAETEYRHQVESDMLPFRDVLLGLFFITVGMRLDLGSLLPLWYWILACVGILIIFKAILITILGKIFRMNLGVAMRTALVLANGGEFGFALLLQATNPDLLNNTILLTDDQTQVILSAIVISMILATLIVRFNGHIAKALVPSYTQARVDNLDRIREESSAMEGHVIVCGYGRSGQNLAWMLEQEGVNTLALDLDPVRVRDARDAGKQVMYGDGSRRDVLEAAGIANASALTVSFDDVSTALKVLEVTRTVRPDLPVIVRTTDDGEIEHLMAAGATEVVPESIEGSLMIGSHVLLLLGVSLSHIVAQVREARHDRYRMLRGFFHGEDVEYDASTYPYRLHSVTLPDQAFAIGKKLKQLNLNEIGIRVTSVRRGGISGPRPDPDTELRVGDVLVLFGSADSLEQAEKRLLEG